MNTINESEIIQKCINGDKNAWETIYKKFSPNVKAFVSGFKFSEAETEDICQEHLYLKDSWQFSFHKIETPVR